MGRREIQGGWRELEKEARLMGRLARGLLLIVFADCLKTRLQLKNVHHVQASVSTTKGLSSRPVCETVRST